MILTLSSLGFHDSSILFILMIIFSSYFFSNLYKKLNIKGNIRCTLLIYALPIFVSFFAWLIFSEYVTLNEIIGSIIIIGSNIYLAIRQKNKSNLI